MLLNSADAESLVTYSNVTKFGHLAYNLINLSLEIESDGLCAMAETQMEIGLDPNGHKITGPLGYYHVDDIQESLRQLLEAGVEMPEAVRDLGGGRLIASLKDADGNSIGLLQSS